LEEDIRDVITCFKFGDDRFWGLASAEGQILPFPIDFDGRPYNTLTLRYDTIEEFNVDWKAEYSALSITRSQKKKRKQTTPVPL